MREAAALIGPLALGLDPLQTMLDLFAAEVDYRHYRMTDITAIMTPVDLRHIHHIQSQVEGSNFPSNHSTGSRMWSSSDSSPPSRTN